MQAHHVDPFTGEDELAMADAALAAEGTTRRPRRAERRAPLQTQEGATALDPKDPVDLGQGRAQRALPVRLGQEIQALPRQARLRRPRQCAVRVRTELQLCTRRSVLHLIARQMPLFCL